jgi:hypothetical protein
MLACSSNATPTSSPAAWHFPAGHKVSASLCVASPAGTPRVESMPGEQAEQNNRLSRLLEPERTALEPPPLFPRDPFPAEPGQKCLENPKSGSVNIFSLILAEGQHA